MLRSSLNIENDLTRIGEDCGYSIGEEAGQLRIGVNWGYTATQVWDTLGVGGILAMLAVLILVAFTGYLVIYNIFQISVAGDIRYYGLLKTIGVTPKQLRRLIRQQALLLSALGIPVGLLLGYGVGAAAVPITMSTSTMGGRYTTVSVSPWIFLFSSVFALLTVLLSCARPGRIAGRVSPVEAVRYTEGGGKTRAKGRKARKVSPFSMAWANLGRSKGKTVVTVLSLSLAVVLLTVTVNFAGGFDMDKYVSNFTASDFIVANAGKFQTSTLFSAEQAVPQSVIDDIDAQGGITDSGVVYGQTSPVLEYVTEDWFRQNKQNFYTPEEMDNLIRLTDKNEAGLLADGVQISGMSDFALDHLTVLEGDLSALYEPGSRAIAAVYSEDDYGNADMASHWARLGDTVTLRYVEESEYYDPDTGEVWASLEDVPDGANWVERPVKYRDVDYTVAALVTVPYALSYRYYGSDEFILNDETFVQDTGTSDVMYYAFDTTDETNAAMESFLADYTENVNPELDYESKATYAGEFESMRSMFLLLGGALSFIVGLVGVLNFFNAILTGIIARQRELAVLQAVGMTGRQLRAMLIWEGLLYALGAAGLALILTLTLGPIAFQAVEGLFWFFTYHLNLTPFLFIIPLFALLGAGIPVITGHEMAKRTVVERLRME